MRCPICDQEMELNLSSESGSIEYCPSCRSVQLDGAELEEIAELLGGSYVPSMPAGLIQPNRVEDSFQWY